MKRHVLDPFSLVFGATFSTLGLMFLLTRVDPASLHLEWIWPVPIIVLGLVIIALATRGRGRPDELIEEGPEPPAIDPS